MGSFIKSFRQLKSFVSPLFTKVKNTTHKEIFHVRQFAHNFYDLKGTSNRDIRGDKINFHSKTCKGNWQDLSHSQKDSNTLFSLQKENQIIKPDLLTQSSLLRKDTKFTFIACLRPCKFGKKGKKWEGGIKGGERGVGKRKREKRGGKGGKGEKKGRGRGEGVKVGGGRKRREKKGKRGDGEGKIRKAKPISFVSYNPNTHIAYRDCLFGD